MMMISSTTIAEKKCGEKIVDSRAREIPMRGVYFVALVENQTMNIRCNNVTRQGETFLVATSNCECGLHKCVCLFFFYLCKGMGMCVCVF